MSEVAEVQTDTGRYSVGQKVVAVGHVLKGPHGTYPAAGFVPVRDELVSIYMVELTCVAHHRSPCAYGGPTFNDGYQFVDEKNGVNYNNQFPRSSNQQLTDTADWSFSVASGDDARKAEHGLMFLRDVTYVIDQVTTAVEFARKSAQKFTDENNTFQAADALERAQLLDHYLGNLKTHLLKLGYQLEFKPMILKDLDGKSTGVPDLEILKAELVPA